MDKVKLDPKELVVFELNVVQFGPFDRPEWTDGVFVVPRVIAGIMKIHYIAMAARENVDIHIKIRNIIPIPLDLYDHFVHQFMNNGQMLYVVAFKSNGMYVNVDHGFHGAFPSLRTLEFSAASGMIPAFIQLGAARREAQAYDKQGLFDWAEGMIK